VDFNDLNIEKDTFHIEKKFAVACDQMKQLQNVISGLRIKHSHLDEVLLRVANLANDVFVDIDNEFA